MDDPTTKELLDIAVRANKVFWKEIERLTARNELLEHVYEAAVEIGNVQAEQLFEIERKLWAAIAAVQTQTTEQK